MTRVRAAFRTIGSLTRRKTRYFLIHLMLSSISGVLSFALVGMSAVVRFLPATWLKGVSLDARLVTSHLLLVFAAAAIMYGTSHIHKAKELHEESQRPRTLRRRPKHAEPLAKDDQPSAQL